MLGPPLGLLGPFLVWGIVFCVGVSPDPCEKPLGRKATGLWHGIVYLFFCLGFSSQKVLTCGN